jgi:hypothetical protein
MDVLMLISEHSFVYSAFERKVLDSKMSAT